jgi:hypothetical protein
MRSRLALIDILAPVWCLALDCCGC